MHDLSRALIAIAIPVVAIIMSLGIPIVAMITGYSRTMRELEQRHQQRMAAIEKGIDLPPDPPARIRPRRSPLLPALIWLGVGLAVVFSGSDFGWSDGQVARLGWVPAAIGIAYLIYYIVEWRRLPQQPDQTDADFR